jgi:cyclopropane-fatty-acyl-phospholipid synthase
MCNRGEVARILGDNSERFIRAWEFYFAGFEAAFRHGGLVVFQIQLTKNLGVTPRTRNYIGSREMPLEDGYRLVAEGKPSGEEPELAAGVDWR